MTANLDDTFGVIMNRMLTTGHAPHYVEIAAELEISPDEGRAALHELFAAGISGWLFPDTDYIASFAPFSNLPSQYRITIDGQQGWFGQCGFESLAVSWLTPGQLVTIDAPCLDCGEPIHIEMRDGTIIGTEPAGLVGHVAVPFRKWGSQLPFA